jgi:hypothetical protein
MVSFDIKKSGASSILHFSFPANLCASVSRWQIWAGGAATHQTEITANHSESNLINPSREKKTTALIKAKNHKIIGKSAKNHLDKHDKNLQKTCNFRTPSSPPMCCQLNLQPLTFNQRHSLSPILAWPWVAPVPVGADIAKNLSSKLQLIRHNIDIRTKTKPRKDKDIT